MISATVRRELLTWRGVILVTTQNSVVVTCSYCHAQEEHTAADCRDLELGLAPFPDLS